LKSAVEALARSWPRYSHDCGRFSCLETTLRTCPLPLTQAVSRDRITPRAMAFFADIADRSDGWADRSLGSHSATISACLKLESTIGALRVSFAKHIGLFAPTAGSSSQSSCNRDALPFVSLL